MAFYRVENLVDGIGLWYHMNDGAKTDFVFELNLMNKDLPMEYDPRIANEKWRSAAKDLDQLKFWFSHEDLLKLTPLGYKLYEIEVKEGHIKENVTELYAHPLFQEVGVTERKEMDINILIERMK